MNERGGLGERRWISADRMTNWRPAFIPPHLREWIGSVYATKAGAEVDISHWVTTPPPVNLNKSDVGETNAR